MTADQLTIPVKDTPPRSPLTEPCVKCGASPGEPCQTATGRRARYEHRDRRSRTRYMPVTR